MAQIQRIMIIGGPGSGKSTLARKLGEITGLPVVHLDRLFWRPGWVQISKDQMNQDCLSAAQTERWIIDGNYVATYAYRVSRADLVVFLDMPRGLRLRRILWRVLMGPFRARPDMAEGCPERIDGEFWEYARNYDRDRRSREATLMVECHERGAPRCVVLRNPQAVQWFLSVYDTKFS